MKRLIFVSLFAGMFLSCYKDNSNVIDINFSNPPIIKSVTVEPKRINLDTIAIGTAKSPDDTLNIKLKVTAEVFDKDGQEDIAETLWEVINPLRGITINSGKLDKLNSSTFYGEPTFKIKRKEIGIYYVKVFSIDKSGFSSNEFFSTLELYRENHPPVISELNAPDTVFVQSQTILIKITIKATDPDGNDDIKSVQFNSFKPDGTPSAGNPFKMYDDGNPMSGDDIAGDGIYSIIIQLPPNTARGTYRFEFQAFDKSNAQSNIITDYMTVL